MSHTARHGRFVIINNTKFKIPHKPERKHTKADVAEMKTTFEKLGFEVTIHENLTKEDMKDLMKSGESLTIAFIKLLTTPC